MAKPSGRPIREELLVAASTLVQRVGVNGFSYGALADELGISAPSIHHHFRTKDDLIAAVVARYRVDFAAHVSEIGADETLDAVERVVAFAALFDATSTRASMCLCGSVASDWATVGNAARTAVHAFFADQITWLADRLDDAVIAGQLALTGSSDEGARVLLAMLEGSMLLARADDDASAPSTLARRFLASRIV